MTKVGLDATGKAIGQLVHSEQIKFSCMAASSSFTHSQYCNDFGRFQSECVVGIDEVVNDPSILTDDVGRRNG